MLKKMVENFRFWYLFLSQMYFLVSQESDSFEILLYFLVSQEGDSFKILSIKHCSIHL